MFEIILEEQFSILLDKYHIRVDSTNIHKIDDNIWQNIKVLYGGDGFERESKLVELLHTKTFKQNIVYYPYLLLLISDYVIEIVGIIQDNIIQFNLQYFKNVMTKNPKFQVYLFSRSISYWNEYYRNEYSLENYPSLKLLQFILDS